MTIATFTEPTRSYPLQFKYNTFLDVVMSDYLPVIGNVIPQKFLTYFDVDDAQLSAGTRNYRKNKHGKSCTQLDISVGGTAASSVTFTEPVDFTSLYTIRNNYSVVTATGNSAQPETMPFIVLDTNVVSLTGAEPLTMEVRFSRTVNGVTRYAYLKNDYRPQITLATYPLNQWLKHQWKPNDTYFIYFDGFEAADWESIESATINYNSGAGLSPAVATVLLGGLWTALPQFQSNNLGATYNPDITDAYYPQVTEATSIFLSQLFGDDINNGEARTNPVKTLEAATLLLTATRNKIVIIDSETYKPIESGKFGLTTQLNGGGNVTIIADYLETPVISAAVGNLDAAKIGARANYRTRFDTAVADITVGSTGADYTTITDAITAASSGDCIEIIDSGTYDEAAITLTKNITIQAADRQTPVWKNSAAVETIITDGHLFRAYGVTFSGNNSSAETRIHVTGNYAGAPDYPVKLFDCTFNSINGAAIYGDGTSWTLADSCFFVDNSSTFIGFEAVANKSNYIITRNCRASLYGEDSFFLRTYRASAAVTNQIQYCEIYETGLGTPCLYYNQDNSGSSYACNVNVIGCYSEATIRLDYAHTQKANTVNIMNNKFKQGVTPSLNAEYSLICLLGKPSAATAINIKGNIFLSDIPDGATSTNNAILCSMDGTSGTDNVTIYSNIFSGTPAGTFTVGLAVNSKNVTSSIPDTKYNVFYGMGRGTYYGRGAIWHGVGTPEETYTRNIFLDNYREFYGVNAVNFDYNIFYGGTKTSTAYRITFGTNQINADPLFSNPAGLDFGWSPTSPIETWRYWTEILFPFLNPQSTNLFALKFIDIQGSEITAGLVSCNTTVQPTYCNIEGFLCGIRGQLHPADAYNSTIQNNGFGIRHESTYTTSSSDVRYNLITGNTVGINLRSGADIQYNTIIDNGYGLAEEFTGMYAQANYMSSYVTVKNNVIIKNIASDYYGTLPTDYNVIFKRYYDSLPLSSLGYSVTAGAHDVASGTILTPLSLCPATKHLGYIVNSPAYLTASDTGYNMGARYLDTIISATLSGESYTLFSTGTVDPAGKFYALENPQQINSKDVAMNPNSARTVRGDYLANPTGYASEVVISWGSPGTDGKINDTGRLALRLVYMTYWIIGVSYDNGYSFTYYRVDKDNPINMDSQKYLFDGLQAYGGLSLHLIEIPDFDITEYEI